MVGIFCGAKFFCCFRGLQANYENFTHKILKSVDTVTRLDHEILTDSVNIHEIFQFFPMQSSTKCISLRCKVKLLDEETKGYH